MNQWGSKIHQNFVATVALLEQNPDAKALYAMRSLWLNLRALLKLAAMIVCIYLAYSDVPSNWHWQQWLVFFVGIVFFVRAGNDHNKASSINRAIRRATPVLDQLEALE